MTPRAVAAALCALLAAHVLASPASAQLRGTVVDSAGKPVPGVTVEVWSPYRQLAVRASDHVGGFRFSPEETQGVGGIFARRPGWETSYLGVPRGDTLVVVRMQREPETLPGLTVRAKPMPCPRREMPRGRALWTALRDRYRGGTDTTTLVAYYQSGVSAGPRAQLGAIETAAATWGWVKSYQGSRRFWRYLIENEGYAHEIRESMDEAYAGWLYPPLESQYPTHFVEDGFGQQHVFTVAAEAEGRTVLRFCPRERSRRRPQVEGTLTLAPDGALVRAAWNYTTPEPRQDAGAEVEFAPSSIHASLLLPATSLYWRRTAGGKYYRRWAKYADWRVAGRHAMPDWTERPGS